MGRGGKQNEFGRGWGGDVPLCQSLFKQRCQVCWFKESFPRLNHVTQLESNIEISKISSYGVWSTHAVPATLLRSGFEPKSADFLGKSLKFADVAAATASGCRKGGGRKKKTKKKNETNLCWAHEFFKPYCQCINSVRNCSYPKDIFVLIVWTIAKLFVIPCTKLKHHVWRDKLTGYHMTWRFTRENVGNENIKYETATAEVHYSDLEIIWIVHYLQAPQRILHID